MNSEGKGRLQDIGGTLGVDAETVDKMRKRTRRLRYLKLMVAGLSPMVALVLGFLYRDSLRPRPTNSMYPYLASIALVAGPIDPRLRAAIVSRDGLRRGAPLIGVIVLTVTAFIAGWFIGGANHVYGLTPKYGAYSKDGSGS